MSRPSVRGKTAKTVLVNLDEREVAALEALCALGLDRADAVRASLLRAAALLASEPTVEVIRLSRFSKKGITTEEAELQASLEKDEPVSEIDHLARAIMHLNAYATLVKKNGR